MIGTQKHLVFNIAFACAVFGAVVGNGFVLRAASEEADKAGASNSTAKSGKKRILKGFIIKGHGDSLSSGYSGPTGPADKKTIDALQKYFDAETARKKAQLSVLKENLAALDKTAPDYEQQTFDLKARIEAKQKEINESF